MALRLPTSLARTGQQPRRRLRERAECAPALPHQGFDVAAVAAMAVVLVDVTQLASGIERIGQRTVKLQTRAEVAPSRQLVERVEVVVEDLIGDDERGHLTSPRTRREHGEQGRRLGIQCLLGELSECARSKRCVRDRARPPPPAAELTSRQGLKTQPVHGSHEQQRTSLAQEPVRSVRSAGPYA